MNEQIFDKCFGLNPETSQDARETTFHFQAEDFGEQDEVRESLEHLITQADSEFIRPSQVKLDDLPYRCVSNLSVRSKYSHSHNKTSPKYHHINEKCFVLTEAKSQSWLVDSGAGRHMTGNKSLIRNMKDFRDGRVKVGDGRYLHAKGIGCVHSPLRLKNVWYVPGLCANVMSVRRLNDSGYQAVFTPRNSYILSNTKHKYPLECKNSLFYMKHQSHVESIVLMGEAERIQLLHKKLGHAGLKAISSLYPDIPAKQLKFFCSTCSATKIKRKSFKHKGIRATFVLERISSDICEIFVGTDDQGQQKRYFVTFLDEKSKLAWVKTCSTKDEVSLMVENFVKTIQRELRKIISYFRTDGGGEYTKLKRFFEDSGIVHEITNPHTPEQNGGAERLNGTLLKLVKALLYESNLSYRMWPLALIWAVKIYNHLPHRSLNFRSPIEVALGHNNPVVQFSKWPVFGSKGFYKPSKAHISHGKTHKLEENRQCIFVGTFPTGYKVIDCETATVVQTPTARFHDGAFFQLEQLRRWKIGRDSDENFNKVIDPEWEPINDHDMAEKEGNTTPSEAIATRSKNNSRIEAPNPMSYEEIQEYLVKNTISEETNQEEMKSTENDEYIESEDTTDDKLIAQILQRQELALLMYGKTTSCCVTEVVDLKMDEVEQDENWRRARDSELKSLDDLGTWKICKQSSVPHGKRILTSKWVFTIKKSLDSIRHKARLVIRGNEQDINSCFSPVSQIESLRLFLSHAVNMDAKLRQADIATAFLIGILPPDQEEYMRLPIGYRNDLDRRIYCLKLQKSLYGLKQAPAIWNEVMHKALMNLGFQNSSDDQCLYTKGKDISLLLYVDDILMSSRDLKKLDEIIHGLEREFPGLVKDMGEPSQMLGLQIRKLPSGGIILNQSLYIEKLKETFHHNGDINSQRCRVPMRPKLEINFNSKWDEYLEPHMKAQYRKLYGSLLFVATRTRPDIALSLSKLRTVISKPSRKCWTYLKTILKYLIITKEEGLHFSKSKDSKSVVVYADSDWAGSRQSSLSHLGYLVYVRGNLIQWKSTRQKCVTLSSCESEYCAASEGIRASIPIQTKEYELRTGTRFQDEDYKKLQHITLMEDNTACIRSISRGAIPQKLRHVRVRYHYIRSVYQQGRLKVKYVPSEKQVADSLTKATPLDLFDRHKRLMNVTSGSTDTN